MNIEYQNIGTNNQGYMGVSANEAGCIEYLQGVVKDNLIDREETCNEDELSNYFIDKGKPHFLPPVFFKREVLKRYYDNPSKYSVNARYLSCLGLWGLPIDINPKGIVYMWLVTWAYSL